MFPIPPFVQSVSQRPKGAISDFAITWAGVFIVLALGTIVWLFKLDRQQKAPFDEPRRSSRICDLLWALGAGFAFLVFMAASSFNGTPIDGSWLRAKLNRGARRGA